MPIVQNNNLYDHGLRLVNEISKGFDAKARRLSRIEREVIVMSQDEYQKFIRELNYDSNINMPKFN